MTFPSLNELLKADLPDEEVSTVITDIVEEIEGPSFDRWQRAQDFTSNIQRGQSYFNGPSPVPDQNRHNPSQLLQCSRKIYYRQNSAPEETADPSGIFWAGEHIETDLILPYLQAVADDVFVQNSIWVDFTVESQPGELRLKGETDPVFVDSEGKPILPTEVKSKGSIEHLDSPNDHHLAQAHAYMAGLTRKFDREITDVLIIYVDRTTLDLKAFHSTFDDKFWNERVLDWAASHTQCRLDRDLPPAAPEYGWECKFCSYKERCGEGDTAHRNYEVKGLLPGFDGYPREKVIEYLEGHPDESLTPCLARKYPNLVEDYGVVDWLCQKCSTEIGWQEVDSSNSPVCPRCAEKNDLSTLSLAREEL